MKTKNASSTPNAADSTEEMKCDSAEKGLNSSEIVMDTPGIQITMETSEKTMDLSEKPMDISEEATNTSEKQMETSEKQKPTSDNEFDTSDDEIINIPANFKSDSFDTSDDEIIIIPEKFKKNLTKKKTPRKYKSKTKKIRIDKAELEKILAAEKEKRNTEDNGTKKKKSEASGTPESECTECKRVKYPETIESFIDNILKQQQPLKAVMSDEYYSLLPLTEVYVGQVRQVKDLSKIIAVLNQKVPLKNLGHLKRAFRKEVLLFPKDYLGIHTHSEIQYYIEENINELRDSFEYFKTVEVPSIAPKVRKQYAECCRLWSCNFHPDKYLELLYTGEIFKPIEIDTHRVFMTMAFEVAVFFMKKQKEDLEPYDILSADLNAAVVVDPKDDSVVAVAFDNRLKHPVQHAAMLAIDNVAKTQQGGAWKTSDIDSVNLKGIGYMELLLHLKHKYPDVKFGARDYLTKSDLKGLKMDASECPYLCTGYYIYLIREPCVMCAMGLVHARVKRVFYCMKNAVGGLGSLTKLHCVPSLNHHFEVFTDFL